MLSSIFLDADILDAVYRTVNVAICLFVIFDINTTI